MHFGTPSGSSTDDLHVNVSIINNAYVPGGSGHMLTSARRVGGIVSPITGIEGVDIAAATELGIVVGNGQTRENTESVAEATILFMLAALYDLHGTETVLRNNLPRPPRMTRPHRASDLAKSLGQ